MSIMPVKTILWFAETLFIEILFCYGFVEKDWKKGLALASLSVMIFVFLMLGVRILEKII